MCCHCWDGAACFVDFRHCIFNLSLGVLNVAMYLLSIKVGDCLIYVGKITWLHVGSEIMVADIRVAVADFYDGDIGNNEARQGSYISASAQAILGLVLGQRKSSS